MPSTWPFLSCSVGMLKSYFNELGKDFSLLIDLLTASSVLTLRLRAATNLRAPGIPRSQVVFPLYLPWASSDLQCSGDRWPASSGTADIEQRRLKLSAIRARKWSSQFHEWSRLQGLSSSSLAQYWEHQRAFLDCLLLENVEERKWSKGQQAYLQAYTSMTAWLLNVHKLSNLYLVLIDMPSCTYCCDLLNTSCCFRQLRKVDQTEIKREWIRTSEQAAAELRNLSQRLSFSGLQRKQEYRNILLLVCLCQEKCWMLMS